MTAISALALTPLPNASGRATLTVAVDDGTDRASTTFVVTVSAVNDPPTLTLPAAFTVTEDLSHVVPTIAVADPDAAESDLVVTLSATSGRLALAAGTRARYIAGASGATRIVVTGTRAVLHKRARPPQLPPRQQLRRARRHRRVGRQSWATTAAVARSW